MGIDDDLTAGNWLESGDGIEEGRLAGAAFATNDGKGTSGNVEINVLEGGFVFVGFGEVM